MTSVLAARIFGAFVAIAGAVAPAGAGTIAAYRHIVLDGHQVKWGDPVAGAGAVVTYAVADAKRTFAGVRNCPGIGPVDALLAASGLGRAAFDAELRAAFALWASAADIRFAPARDPMSADIVIGAQLAPRGRAFTNVEYETADAPSGIRRLTRSLVCLNPQQPWKIGFDGDLEVYDLRYALLHEIGHAIGLDHPAIDNQLMDFRYSERFRTPQAGDIRGVLALYGPRTAGPSAEAADRGPPSAVRKVGLGLGG